MPLLISTIYLLIKNSYLKTKFRLNGIKYVKTGKAGENEFDAITGATETSKAVQRILNKGFSKYFELRKKQGAQ